MNLKIATFISNFSNDFTKFLFFSNFALNARTPFPFCSNKQLKTLDVSKPQPPGRPPTTTQPPFLF